MGDSEPQLKYEYLVDITIHLAASEATHLGVVYSSHSFDARCSDSISFAVERETQATVLSMECE